MPPPGVKARVDRFWRSIKRLEAIFRSEEEFLANEDKIDAAERNLQVAVEAVIDVGAFLVSSMGWETPKSYRDIGRILARKGVFSDRDAALFERAVKLRNIIVHNYIYVEPRRILSEGKLIASSLTSLMDKILKYAEERGMDP